jgi:hypothetical protein
LHSTERKHSPDVFSFRKMPSFHVNLGVDSRHSATGSELALSSGWPLSRPALPGEAARRKQHRKAQYVKCGSRDAVRSRVTARSMSVTRRGKRGREDAAEVVRDNSVYLLFPLS